MCQLIPTTSSSKFRLDTKSLVSLDDVIHSIGVIGSPSSSSPR